MVHINKLYKTGLRKLVLISLLSIITVNVHYAIEGIPSIKNFTHNEYRAGNQNWAIAQDEFNVMYFGNNNGILIFNGTDWHLTPVPNLSIVRSLKAGPPGKILAGAFDELGIVIRDSLGSYRYLSWKYKVPSEEGQFGDIWRIHIIEKYICFQSRTHLLVFNTEGDYITTLHPDNEFIFSFMVNGQLIVQDKDAGLKKLESMQLISMPGGDQINHLEIWDIQTLPDNKLLLFSQQNGVYIWDSVSLKEWNRKISEFLRENSFYCMTLDNSGNLYIGTIQQGILIIKPSGQIDQTINKVNGLQNNTILSMAFDSEENLWLGLDNGIDYVETHSNVSYLRQPGGFGSGYCSIMLNNNLYLGTNQGVFIYPTQQAGIIEPLARLNGQTWSFFANDNKLLCAHHSGAYILTDKEVRKIDDIQGIWMFLSVPWDSDKLLIGTYGGIGLLQKSGTQYVFRGMLNGFNESSRVMFFDTSDNLWISHGYNGIYRLRINQNNYTIEEVKLYGPEQGLPSKLNNELFGIRGELIAGTRNGIYEYEELRDTFYSSLRWNRFLGSHDPVAKMIESQEHTVWVFQNGVLGKLDILSDSLYQYNRQLAPSLNDNFLTAFESITFLSDEQILIGIEDGFSIVDLETGPYLSTSVPFQFTRFEIFNTHKFQTQYNAIMFDPMATHITLSDKIPYKLNNLRIKYALPVYCSSYQISIQYSLNETSWEGTPGEPEIILSNLKEGKYKLTIIIENPFTNSREYRNVHFTVDAPWFRRWYTYAGFSLIFISVILITFRIISKSIQRQKRKALLEQKRQMIQREIRLKEKSHLTEQELIRMKNEKLQAEVVHKSKELANSTMNIIHKSQVLTNMKIRLMELIENDSGLDKEELHRLVRKIDRELDDKQSWNVFETHFDRVHENFFSRLREKHKTLTPKDLRMCAFLRMNLSSKEIAPLQNISIRSVEISRYRLRKKLNLSHDKNLTDFIMGI